MSQSNPTKTELNKYASHYVLNGCQSKAFRHAFPKSKASDEAIHVKASNLHKLDKVQLRIKELEEEARKIAEEEFKLDAKYVAQKLKEIAELDVLDIMESDLKSFKPLDKWPKAWRTSISGLDLMTLANSDENIEAMVRKVKWPDKTKNLELIGKLTVVSAFSDNIKIDSNENITPWGEIKASVDKLED